MTTATALAFFHRYNTASPDPSYDPYVRFLKTLNSAVKSEKSAICLTLHCLPHCKNQWGFLKYCTDRFRINLQCVEKGNI